MAAQKRLVGDLWRDEDQHFTTVVILRAFLKEPANHGQVTEEWDFVVRQAGVARVDTAKHSGFAVIDQNFGLHFFRENRWITTRTGVDEVSFVFGDFNIHGNRAIALRHVWLHFEFKFSVDKRGLSASCARDLDWDLHALRDIGRFIIQHRDFWCRDNPHGAGIFECRQAEAKVKVAADRTE